MFLSLMYCLRYLESLLSISGAAFSRAISRRRYSLCASCSSCSNFSRAFRAGRSFGASASMSGVRIAPMPLLWSSVRVSNSCPSPGFL